MTRDHNLVYASNDLNDLKYLHCSLHGLHICYVVMPFSATNVCEPHSFYEIDKKSLLFYLVMCYSCVAQFSMKLLNLKWLQSDSKIDSSADRLCWLKKYHNNPAQKPFNYGAVFLKKIFFLNIIKIELKSSQERKTFACNSIVQRYN